MNLQAKVLGTRTKIPTIMPSRITTTNLPKTTHSLGWIATQISSSTSKAWREAKFKEAIPNFSTTQNRSG